MRSVLIAVLTLVAPLMACGQTPSSSVEGLPPVAIQSVGFVALYDALLKHHVDADGWVDYTALMADRDDLDGYIGFLARPSPSADAPADERLAHLINAYNAFTLQLILDAGIPDSIIDLEGGKPWDVVQWNLGGQFYSLNQIEHELIRPVFNEPRIHWALVCAAYSCPPLRNAAYTAENLEEQLAQQEAYVLSFDHPRYVARHEKGGVQLTPLFEWYGEDFGDAKDYAAERLGLQDASVIDGFLVYDWGLNDIANRDK
ncbi:MAG: DUF547 domain-containing protein [Algisphaera sp.]